MRILILFIVLGSVCHAELRTWTAVNGKKVEAEFVSNSDGQVSLKMKSGKVFKVPLNKLSKADQDFLKAKSSPAKPVPAEPPSEKPSDTPKSLSEADIERLLEVSIDIESLEERNGLMYQVNESEPYSGWGKLMYDSGQVERLVPYKDGRWEGLWTIWHENGQKEMEGRTRKDGRQEGLATLWYKNGQKRRETTYKYGREEGLRTTWHENGQKSSELTTKDDVQFAQKYWNSKGEPVDSREEANKE